MFKKSVSNLYLFKSRQHNDKMISDNSYVKRKIITSVIYFISCELDYSWLLGSGDCRPLW